MPRRTRLIGTLTASALIVTALTQSAHADSSEIDTGVAPSLAAAAVLTTSSTTADGITALLTPTSTAGDGLTFSFNATGSTDANSGATITGYSFAYGDGTAASNTTGQISHTYVTPGSYDVSVTVTDSLGNSATTTASVTTPGNDYTPDGPTRILDTRNGTGAAKAKVTAGKSISVQVAGVDDIPGNATAVVLNLTAVDTVDTGLVTAYADGTTPPDVSNSNFVNGQTIDDLVTVPVGGDGKIALEVSGDADASADLVGDLQGYYSPTAANAYTAIQPGRILDTRSGLGAPKAALASGATLVLPIDGAKLTTNTNTSSGNTTEALPSTGITAVVLNLTATDDPGNGVITAYPDGTARPSTANLNYSSANIADDAIVPVGADGKIDLNNSNTVSTNTTELIADVEGYFTAGNAPTTSVYVPITPTRIYDTRTEIDGAVPAGDYLHLSPNTGTAVTAYAFNITATQGTSIGDLAVYPDATADNITSTVNFNSDQNIGNFDQATVSATGIDIANHSTGTTQVVVDEFGYFTNQ